MPSSEVIRNNNRLFQYALRDAPERQSNKEPSWRKRFFRFFNQFISPTSQDKTSRVKGRYENRS